MTRESIGALLEKEEEVLLDLPYHKLEGVLLFGNIQVTSQAMAELLEKGVRLSLFSHQGRYRGSLEPARGRNIELRLAQFDAYRNRERALGIAREVVGAKIGNGLAVLARYAQNNPVPEGLAACRAGLEKSQEAAGKAADIAELDGVEGSAARAYFDGVMAFNKSGMEWKGRQKHPATDPLNALLSLAYTMVMHELGALLEGAGLDPYLGYLHQPDYGRPSLALDLLEPFRHPLADRLVLTLINRRVIAEEDFRPGGEGPGVFLAPGALKRFFGEYERWMLDTKQSGGGSFRGRLKAEVEGFAAALGRGEGWQAFRYGVAEKKEEACSTSSVTI